MKNKHFFILSVLLSLIFAVLVTGSFAGTIFKDGKVFINDRTGELWDITQAVSIGFDPDEFEFGLGRNAFSPLDDSRLQDASMSIPGKLRVLGVPGTTQSKAFSVKKLGGHEIANSFIDDQPIAAAY